MQNPLGRSFDFLLCSFPSLWTRNLSVEPTFRVQMSTAHLTSSRATLVALFALNSWLIEYLLSAINRFEFPCQSVKPTDALCYYWVEEIGFVQ